MTSLQRLLSLVRAAALLPIRIANHRRVLATLGQFDDRELADIGLTRQDLRDATALPLAADPTNLFTDRAQERAALRAQRLAAE